MEGLKNRKEEEQKKKEWNGGRNERGKNLNMEEQKCKEKEGAINTTKRGEEEEVDLP